MSCIQVNMVDLFLSLNHLCWLRFYRPYLCPPGSEYSQVYPYVLVGFFFLHGFSFQLKRSSFVFLTRQTISNTQGGRREVYFLFNFLIW